MLFGFNLFFFTHGRFFNGKSFSVISVAEQLVLSASGG